MMMIEQASKPEQKINITVYTGIFGDYDRLHEPRTTCGFKFVCYTDNPKLRSDAWEIKVLPKSNRHPRWAARECKLLRFKEFDTPESLWIDGRYQFIDLIRQPKYQNILLQTHPHRTCAYDEASFCLYNNIGNSEDIKKTYGLLRLSGFPKEYGLWYTSTMWRKHTVDTEKLCDTWWAIMANGSVRDQISLPFALWKTGINYTSHQFACHIHNFHSFVELKYNEHLKTDLT